MNKKNNQYLEEAMEIYIDALEHLNEVLDEVVASSTKRNEIFKEAIKPLINFIK
jgi:hypothetical protein